MPFASGCVPGETAARLAGIWGGALLSLTTAGCVELAPDPPRRDVTGCYRITLPGSEEARAPAPPMGLELTDDEFVAEDARAGELARHRFDARSAREAFFLYPDTAYRVAWWWEVEEDRLFGVGNRNQAAAFYIEGVARGDRLEGEMRRWLYDSAGRPLDDPDSWTAPITGRREGCRGR